MKLRYHLGLVALVGLSALALLPVLQADEPAKLQDKTEAADPRTLPEVQDVIFFTDKRPVLLRMRLYADGKPACERWETFQKKLFDYLDTDHDGFLDKDEASHVIPASDLIQLMAGVQNLNGLPMAPAFADLDTDKDGKVSREELAAYYRRNDAGPYVNVTGQGLGQTADQLTNALFTALDVNKDGKLSREELLAADRVLMRFDDNDDEIITPQELLATAINPYAPVPQPRVPGNKGGKTSILLVPYEDPANLGKERYPVAKEVLAHYDKDKNNKLSREEIGFSKELFDALDKDKKGEITAQQLMRWVGARTADLECTVRLGRVADKTKLIEAGNDGKGRDGLSLNSTSQTTLATKLENSEVTVLRGNLPNAGGGGRGLFAQVQQIFKVIDKTNRGYVTSAQLANNPQYASLHAILAIAVREDKDSISLKELEAFVDVASSAAGSQVAITFSDNGQGLFDMLDSNSDGRLSIREMRNAWTRLAPYAHDGSITHDDIPRQYSLTVGGAANQNGRQVAVAMGEGMAMPPRGTPGSLRGPLWFRKMDVNGDGDVSEREFLGSREDFRRINTSGDGLISVEEAEKADEWFRKKSEE